MSLQTTYPNTLDQARVGMIASAENVNFISKTVETAAGVGFGIAVAQGAADGGCIAFAGSGTILGITVRAVSMKAETDTFEQYDACRIMTKGTIFVQASVAVNAGEQVYVTDAGAFTNSDSGTTILPGAFFDSSTSGAGLAKVRLG